MTPVVDDGPIRLIGVIILLVAFGLFALWSYWAPIDGAALASGVITVKSHRKTVQHLDGGIVNQIFVKDGDIVREGDTLLILDGTEAHSQLEVLRGQSIALSAQLARLEAERDRKARIEFPDNLSRLDDTRVAEARTSETELFSARRVAFEGQISVLKQKINQLSTQIVGIKGQRQSKQALSESYGEEAKDLKELLAEGFADKQRLRDTERNHASNAGDIASLTSQIAAAEIQIGETKLEILQLEKKFQEEVSEKLSEIQSQLYDVNQRLAATADKVSRIEIKAPVSGRVMGLTIHTQGGVVMAGNPILDIVPQQEDLIIDARVSPLDIDRIRLGLVAEVRFSAFKQALTPTTEGKVIHISADRFVDEKADAAYYQAEVELTPESLQKLKNLELVPGMPVEVMIRTGERTVVEYLMQPITDAFARAFRED
ncbi:MULTISPECIES: HlyD family type I secretion periplasmic adaptor subunit [Methylomonas]|nr:HlyD family type I secretion periplasmic adaptor subunit [Methylomonas koyamae]